MNWEFVGAIAGVLALILTVILEWEKLINRFRSIPPKFFSYIAYGFFFTLQTFGSFAWFEEKIIIQFRSIGLVILIGSYILQIFIGNKIVDQYIHESDKGVFRLFFTSVLPFIVMINSYFFVNDPYSLFN